MTTVAVESVQDALYECSDCGDAKPAAEMQHEREREPGSDRRTGEFYLTSRCRLCNQAIRLANAHALEKRRRPDGVVPELTIESDAGPARHLRIMLVEDRAGGWGFDEAWREDVEAALRAVSDPATRRLWAVVFEETRSAWQAGWDRDSSGFPLSAELMDVA